VPAHPNLHSEREDKVERTIVTGRTFVTDRSDINV
jgi:hypothetical protein